jgi:hypothetical protein
MSGPPLPRPTTSAIGKFKIGISPIGTIPAFDWWSTVMSQFANSPIITGIIQNVFQSVDTTLNFENFYDFVFNLATAQGYGLDVWGRILGVSRILNVGTGGPFIGWEEALPGSSPWGQGIWFSSGSGLTSNYALSDSAYRILLFAKGAANVSNASLQSINKILLSLFPNRGNCYCTDGLDQTMTYTFTFPLSPVELSIIGQSGALPKPAGVAVSVVAP